MCRPQFCLSADAHKTQFCLLIKAFRTHCINLLTFTILSCIPVMRYEHVLSSFLCLLSDHPPY